MNEMACAFEGTGTSFTSLGQAFCSLKSSILISLFLLLFWYRFTDIVHYLFWLNLQIFNLWMQNLISQYYHFNMYCFLNPYPQSLKITANKLPTWNRKGQIAITLRERLWIKKNSPNVRTDCFLSAMVKITCYSLVAGAEVVAAGTFPEPLALLHQVPSQVVKMFSTIG